MAEMNRISLEQLIKLQETRDYYILDEENAIIIINNDNKATRKDYWYTMIHERLINGKLVEINRWNSKWILGSQIKEVLLKNYHLFKIPDKNNFMVFSTLYDYKNDCFVVPSGIWNELEFGYPNNCLLQKYDGIRAYFELSSDYEDDDYISYYNPLTDANIIDKFIIHDKRYYAILNFDGTIRGNKLFRGESFSKIEDIIDLNEYESLEDFKNQRKRELNELKQRKKQAYRETITKHNTGDVSPYLDNEVFKIVFEGRDIQKREREI